MDGRKTTLERAYELARSGRCAGINDIRSQLKAEGYAEISGQLYGGTTTKALRELCVGARAINLA